MLSLIKATLHCSESIIRNKIFTSLGSTIDCLRNYKSSIYQQGDYHPGALKVFN